MRKQALARGGGLYHFNQLRLSGREVALDLHQLRVAIIDGEMVDYTQCQLKTGVVQLVQAFCERKPPLLRVSRSFARQMAPLLAEMLGDPSPGLPVRGNRQVCDVVAH